MCGSLARFQNLVATGLWPVHFGAVFDTGKDGPQGRGYSGYIYLTRTLKASGGGFTRQTAIDVRGFVKAVFHDGVHHVFLCDHNHAEQN